MNNKAFATHLINVFEVFLEEHDAVIPNDERPEAAYEVKNPEDLAIIFGSHYTDLQNMLLDFLNDVDEGKVLC